jgi:RNA polymerase sigma-70 factor (sigma-E family)
MLAQHHRGAEAFLSKAVAKEAVVSLEEYVRVRGPSLLRFGLVLTGDQHAAEDLLQSTLAHVIPRWRRISRAEHQDRYVQRVMVSLFLQGKRRKSSSEVVTAELPPEASLQDVARGVADRDQVHHLLASLSPTARAVVVLRFYLDWDDQMIADHVGMTPGSVRSSLSRSLGGLRSITHSVNTGE